MLNDPELTFDDRSAVDLKDRWVRATCRALITQRMSKLIFLVNPLSTELYRCQDFEHIFLKLTIR